MINETNQTNVEKDDMMFHFVPEIGENTIDINDISKNKLLVNLQEVQPFNFLVVTNSIIVL